MKALAAVKNKALLRNLGYVNGKFIGAASGEVFSVTDPASGADIMQVPRMEANDAAHAIDASKKAFGQWKSSTGSERSKFMERMMHIMRRNADDLALIICAEAGKPFNEAKGEVMYALNFYEFYCEEAKRITGEILPAKGSSHRLFAMREAVGPTALITPWNFPSAMITRKVGPALAAGCSVVIKPAEQTPLSALALCAIAHEAGLPPGVLNCLTVAREDVESVGLELCHSSSIKKVSFTGSTAVGKWLMRESASTVKKVSMELGGNAPFLVFDDADLDVALKSLIAAKFRNAGQACIASNRVLVQAGVYEKFSAMIAAAAHSIPCDGDPAAHTAEKNPYGTIGPLIDHKAVEKVTRQVEDCVSKGAVAVVGGKAHETLNAAGGNFFMPTVLTGVTREMLPYHEETFGPVVPLIKFSTESEAVAMANDTPFGLAAYACTSDISRMFRLADNLESGMVGINEGGISAAGMGIPFGGFKESGVGREGGTYGLDEYLETKYVCIGGIQNNM